MSSWNHEATADAPNQPNQLCPCVLHLWACVGVWVCSGGGSSSSSSKVSPIKSWIMDMILYHINHYCSILLNCPSFMQAADTESHLTGALLVS